MSRSGPYRFIEFHVQDRVALITLNRPDRLNAWTPGMEDEYHHALDRAVSDDAASVICITGSGRGFCAGADREIIQENMQSVRRGDHVAHADLNAFWNAPKLTVAGINGHAVGLGMSLAMACDVRVASDAATISLPYVKLGLPAEDGLDWSLVHACGLARARDLLLTGRTISADEAHMFGLVSQVYPAVAFRSSLWSFVSSLANSVNPAAVSAIKDQLVDPPENLADGVMRSRWLVEERLRALEGQ